MTKSLQIERVDRDLVRSRPVDLTSALRRSSRRRMRRSTRVRRHPHTRVYSERTRRNLVAEATPARSIGLPRAADGRGEPGFVETAVSLVVMVLVAIGANRALVGDLYLAVLVLLASLSLAFAIPLRAERERMGISTGRGATSWLLRLSVSLIAAAGVVAGVPTTG